MINTPSTSDPLPDLAWLQRFSRDLDLHLAFRALHVVVVGTGFIGGHVAWLLAQMGVGHLFLCDPDILSVANLSRHIADPSYVDSNKALATGSTIAKRLPGAVVEVEVIPRDLTADSLADLTSFLLGKDAVVLATGNAVVDRFINRFTRRLGILTLVPGLMPGRSPLIGDLLIAPGDYQAAGCIECIRPPRTDEPRGVDAQPGLVAEGMLMAAHTALAVVDGLIPATRGHRYLTENLNAGRNYLLLARNPLAATLVRTHHNVDCQACGIDGVAILPHPRQPAVGTANRPWLAASIAGVSFLAVFEVSAVGSATAGITFFVVLIAATMGLIVHFLSRRQ